MKTLFQFTLLLISSSIWGQSLTTSAQQQPRKALQSDFQTKFGDTLHVWADALRLRKMPAADAGLLAKIPFGSKVIVADTQIGQFAHTYPLIPSITKKEKGQQPYRLKELTVTGHWLAVAWNGQKGYVFDGFLSHFPVFYRNQIQNNASDKGKTPRVLRYFDKIYTPVRKEYDMAGACDCLYDNELYEHVYSNGLIVKYGDFGDCGSGNDVISKSTELHIRNISLVEGALIAHKVWDLHNNRIWNDGDPNPSDDGGYDHFYGFIGYTVRKSGDYIIIRP